MLLSPAHCVVQHAERQSWTVSRQPSVCFGRMTSMVLGIATGRVSTSSAVEMCCVPLRPVLWLRNRSHAAERARQTLRSGFKAYEDEVRQRQGCCTQMAGLFLPKSTEADVLRQGSGGHPSRGSSLLTSFLLLQPYLMIPYER